MKHWVHWSFTPLTIYMALAAAACGSGDPAWADGVLDAPAAHTNELEERPEDARARGVLAELAAEHPALLAFGAGVAGAGGRAQNSVSGPGTLLQFEPERARWVKRAGGAQGERGWSASLPELADEPFEIREAASGLGLRVRARGAAAVAAGHAGSFLVYPNAHGPGTALLYRIVGSGLEEHGIEGYGLEDYVTFDARPSEPSFSYDVALSTEVAGLRLVERTLEFVDGRGAPRLRVTPPYLIGARGERVLAKLEVRGCAYDSDAAAPWDRAPVAPGAAQCEMRVSWDDAALTYPAVLDPLWAPAGSMAFARERFASALLSNGRVLVTGGVSGPTGAALESAELYDPDTGAWAVTGAMSVGRSDHTLTPENDGHALAAGGRDSDGSSFASCERYDASLGLWLDAPAMPSPRAGHRAALLPNGDLLVAGGAQSTVAARFSRAAAGWLDAGSYGSEQPGATLTAVSRGRALLLGPNAPSAQLWDPATNQWSATGAPALGRSGHTATRLSNGEVLVVGGTGALSTEIFDPARGRFRAAGATNDVHTGHSATLLPNGRVVVVGGGSGDPLAAPSELYNPTWGTWAPGPAPIEPRTGHEAVLLPSGQLLIVGGVPAGSSAPGEPDPDAAPPALASSEDLDARLPETKITEYKFQASLDRDVSVVVTELWAAVARPSVLEAGRRYPLILFLHGNHATCGTGVSPRQDIDCTYTETGICPGGFVVAPSHRGYDYVISELAARGYIVVSVNANRGINCGGADPEDFSMNTARGRLLLKHLQRLAQWHRGVAATPASIGVSLQGKLDFSEVGIMGHSRGGEGARAAYQLFRDPGSPWPARIIEPLAIRGIFEIGPVDGQTPRIFNADGAAWNVLLPMCDGDVSDLQGVKPFDRMLGLSSEAQAGFKSTYTAWGTNHNYFNSEWQQSDSGGCTDHEALFDDGPGITGSAEQRQIGLRSLLAFFLAKVGTRPQPELEALFDPAFPVQFHTRVDRGYTPGLGPADALTLENFSGPSGSSMRRIPTVSSNVSVTHGGIPEHDDALRGASIVWNTPSANRFFEVRFAGPELGVDLGDYATFDFRIDRAPDSRNPEAASTVVVQLVNPDGTLSEPVDMADHGVVLDGPVGGPFNLHSMLQTVRIPLSEFLGSSAEAVAGVRFSFADPRGALFLASIRASTGDGAAPVAALTAGARAPANAVVPGVRAAAAPQVNVAGNQVVALRLKADRSVELELRAGRAFQAKNQQLVLDLGGKAKTARSFHPGGDLRRVVFSLEPASYDAAATGDPLTVQYGASGAEKWEFGALDKSKLAP